MNRRAAGLAQLALIGVIVGALGFAAVTGLAYWRGDAAGAARATAERNAHWQRIVDKLQADARQAVAAEAQRVQALQEQWRLARQGADHERERERAANAARLAAAAADRDRLRDELAAAAAGGVTEAADSVAACRDRAATLGGLLGSALRASEQCAGEAEDVAAELRRVRAAWPRNDEVKP